MKSDTLRRHRGVLVSFLLKICHQVAQTFACGEVDSPARSRTQDNGNLCSTGTVVIAGSKITSYSCYLFQVALCSPKGRRLIYWMMMLSSNVTAYKHAIVITCMWRTRLSCIVQCWIRLGPFNHTDARDTSWQQSIIFVHRTSQGRIPNLVF